MKTIRISMAVAPLLLSLAVTLSLAPRAPALAAPPGPAPLSPPGPGTLIAPGKPAGAGGATGTIAVASPPLPPARPVDAILADVIAAVGGAAALDRHRSLHSKMEITFRGLGITGSAEHYAMVGDKVLTITSIPNLASTREGSDGTRFWSDDPINGLRILEGAEADQARIEGAWNAELRVKELFARIEARNELAPSAGDGTRLECLILTPKTGPAMTECFDAKTHLMAVQRGVRSGPQGDMPFVARLSDWRQVGGDLKLAFATEMQVGPLAFSGRVTSVEMDVPIDASLFAVPSVPRPAAGRKGDSAEAGKTGAPGKSRARSDRRARSTRAAPADATAPPPQPAAPTPASPPAPPSPSPSPR